MKWVSPARQNGPLPSRKAFPARGAEWKLILACSRTRLDDLHRREIRALLQGPLDWTLVRKAAAEHSVEGLLQRSLSDAASEAIPAEVLLSFKEGQKQRTQWSLLLAGQMVELLERCEKAGFILVPFKGPTLALAAYGDLGLRFAGDLDFVTRQREVPRAFDVLLAAGYTGELDPGDPHQARMIARGKHVGQYCFRKAGAGLVELHTENTLRYFPKPLDWEGLCSRLRPIFFGSRTIYTFSVEDLLVLLSVHGAKHFWNRLSWICDIAELSQLETGVDWDLSERVASSMECRRMWLLGLSLAHRMLGTALPASLLNQIRNDHVVGVLSQRVESSMGTKGRVEPGVPERLWFRMRSHDSMAQGLQQCGRLVTRPTERDWLTHSLPGWAAPLHTVLRPWQLLRRYGLGNREAGPRK